MSASVPPPFAVGHFEIELREGVFSGPWVASLRRERPGGAPVYRCLTFTRRADAEIACVTWALGAIEALDP